MYTFSHIVGYGLLYQLTGDQLYADLGRDAMERALAGQRDRDDRYSFANTGGALRSGPVIGWTAVGYDLCYDGWDPEFRQTVTQELFNYGVGNDNKTLDELIRGTKPPGSNHFWMQIGGATMALLAIDQEPGIDQDQLDIWLRVSQHSMIRNVVEGFGNGGVFAEGDGTGSMASFIAYLSAVQAWRTAKGLDMLDMAHPDTARPDIPMMTLKWLYLSRMNKPAVLQQIPDLIERGRAGWDRKWIDFPARGEYQHNIWARETISGTGYFGIGFGALLPHQQAAMRWFYDSQFAEIDAALGRPFDSFSFYPHATVCSFINWPFDQEPVNPAEVLPKIYVDSESGFVAGRERWQDHNDFVVSMQVNMVRTGYMILKNDRRLTIDRTVWADLGQAKQLVGTDLNDAGDQVASTIPQ